MATVPPRILLVEDDERIADAVCGGLRSEGFEVDRASEGQEARVLFEIKDYQVAILGPTAMKIRLLLSGRKVKIYLIALVMRRQTV